MARSAEVGLAILGPESRSTPFTVVLTGGIAAGKTVVSDLFAEMGVPVIDTDRIAHELVEPGQPALEQIRAEFGPEFLDSAGRLNRQRMREKIFQDPDSRICLEQILHPLIAREVQRQCSLVAKPYCIVVVPLYTESARWSWIDRVLVVDAAESVQIERLLQRDGGTIEQARAILQAQAGRDQRLALADDVIHNDGSLEEIRNKVTMLHDKYLRLIADISSAG